MIKMSIEEYLTKQVLINKTMMLRVGPKKGFEMARMQRALAEELKTFNEQRQTILDRHNVTITEDNKADIPQESAEDFHKEFNELLAVVMELPGEPISEEDLKEDVSPLYLIDNPLIQIDKK
jgi:hypothetical protein